MTNMLLSRFGTNKGCTRIFGEIPFLPVSDRILVNVNTVTNFDKNTLRTQKLFLEIDLLFYSHYGYTNTVQY